MSRRSIKPISALTVRSLKDLGLYSAWEAMKLRAKAKRLKRKK